MGEIVAVSDRLVFKHPRGWMNFGRIPYKVHYSLNSPTSEIVSKKIPGRHMVTPDTDGGESLSVFVHKSVPRQYRDIVAFHELTEAELVHADGLKVKEAHKQAVVETDKYARQYMSPEEYKQFVDWQKSLAL